LCQRGRIVEAEALIRGILSLAPRDDAALHMLGTIACQHGDRPQAIGLFCQAIAINGRVAAYHGNLGNVYLETARLGEAAGCYRRALALEPGSVLAHFGLGLALLGQKAYPAAATELAKALKARPDHGDTHLNLGIALTELGHIDEAIAHCRRAVALNPGYAGGHLRLGIALRAKDELPSAFASIARAIELDPVLADAHYQLGITLHALDRPDEATRVLRQALELRPDMVEALYQLGRVLTELQEFEKAMRCYERALALDPRSPALLRGIGQVLYFQGRFEEGRGWFTRALECAPDDADSCAGIGWTYEAQGHFEDATAWHKKAIELQPDHADAHYGLAMMPSLDNAEARIRELERVLGLGSLDGQRRAALNFALAKVHDEAGDYDAAFRCFKAGNDLRMVGPQHRPEEYSAFVDRVIATFGKELFAKKGCIGSESERPVFIVGMMRSGTTLVEQILASHPQVYGHGELDYLRQIQRSLPDRLGSSERYPECAAALDAATARGIAEAHVARLERDAGEAVRSVDKRPHNFALLGLIALLFPRARLIHCMRDPLDTCLSGYFHDFGHRNAFTCDLDHLGRFYRDYQRLMAHWHATLPSAILDVPYEALVGASDVWSRKLVDFLDLTWDERCLAFHQTERSVLTSSMWQVRQPIYTGSIGRWRHYAKHLGPLFEGLGIVPPME
jgi:tetratricopeptide (TPR) repeat protein